MSIGHDRPRLYQVRVVTPRGLVVEVTSYGLRTRKGAVSAARRFADMLARVPTARDPAPLREAWVDLVVMGQTPRMCRVEIVRRSDEAGDDRPHGWETLAVLEPRATSIGSV